MTDETGEPAGLPPIPAALRRRRFAVIPLRGPGAAFTEAQGREPGPATSPRELSDLISSISEVGVIQPILVEELAGEEPDTAGALRVVVGERRLRACRWGASHMPDNPHFAGIPASICPGPLSEEDRRVWQLIENLAREPLRPGEQAAALLYQRCAQLTISLRTAGLAVPDEVTLLDDPVARFQALEKIRDGDASLSVSWSTVLTRLGLQLTTRRASELVRAFRILPRELSQEMDEHGVRVATRIRFAGLRSERQSAADEIWLALKSAGRADLLNAAAAAAADPALNAQEAVEHASEVRERANQTRAQALTKPAAAAAAPPDDVSEEEDDAGEPDGTPPPPGGRQGAPAAGPEPAPEPPPVPRPAVDAVLDSLRTLLTHLRRGEAVPAYDRGSLSLLLDELTVLTREAGHGAAHTATAA